MLFNQFDIQVYQEVYEDLERIYSLYRHRVVDNSDNGDYKNGMMKSINGALTLHFRWNEYKPPHIEIFNRDFDNRLSLKEFKELLHLLNDSIEYHVLLQENKMSHVSLKSSTIQHLEIERERERSRKESQRNEEENGKNPLMEEIPF